MDFSKFKVASAPIKQAPKEKRYVLKVSDYLFGKTLVRVIDTEDSNKEVLRVETTKPDYWIERIKKDYRPIEHDS